MTAIVGIINREAVAIAADSAITTMTTGKVVNGVNKIFSISHKPPVALGFYHLSSFLGLSWETISKEFRDRNKSHNTVEEYADDFQHYLIELAASFDNKLIMSFWRELFHHFCNELLMLYQNNSQNAGNYLNVQVFLSQFKESLSNSPSLTENLPDFINLKDEFERGGILLAPTVAPIFQPLIQDVNILLSLFHLYLDKQPQLSLFTGLFLTGFGKTQLFPAIKSFQLIGYFGGKLIMRADEDKSTILGPNDLAAVIPFAQDDVIKTVVQGVSPIALEWFTSQVPLLTQSIHQGIANKLNKLTIADAVRLEITSTIESIGLVIEDQFQANLENFITSNYVTPTLQTLALLPKQDLADLAESWLHLTFLNRRMTGQLESVGGEIDVLLITKGDGLIWVKRKHYFDPNQNYQFFVTKLASILSRT